MADRRPVNMTDNPQSHEERLQDALIAAELFAHNPAPLGGLVIKAHAGPVRSRYLEFLRSCLPASVPLRKLPLTIQDERLLGGLDLTATLAAGKPVLSRGVLADIHGGVLMVAMAERMSPSLAARLASVMDRRQVVIAREGLSAEIDSAFGLVLMDESVADDEQIAPELMDRIAFHIDLRDVSVRELDQALDLFQACSWDRDLGAPSSLASRAVDANGIGDEITRALCATAMALGIASIRAAIFARRVAEQAGRWMGHVHPDQEDATLAARLVLAPRATRLPSNPEDPPPESPPADDTPAPDDRAQHSQSPNQDLENLDDVVLESAKAAIPAGLLAQLLSDQRLSARSSGSGKSGAQKKAVARGRPLGARQGLPEGRARLSIIDTLRAAAPWQKLRGGLEQSSAASPSHGRDAFCDRPLRIRAEDFRIKRFKDKTETTTIFVVDASGSSAIHRLAEAKGAVELLLADCYVRRDQVAVIAFRGQQAEMILPPTRSLVRAKRGLSGLPGGGGTPLALAIDASVALAMSIARKGETPLVVMLTDGKANIGRDGKPGREQANRDAVAAADQFAITGYAAMVIDTSPQPSSAAQLIAQHMHARYMPLPHAGAAQVNHAIRSMHS